jgi:hypothetical protein
MRLALVQKRSLSANRPLPKEIASYSGDGKWDDEFFGQGAPITTPGWRYCCFPDCAWIMGAQDVACHAHAALVGHGRVRDVGALAVPGAAEQPFEYELAVELLAKDMVDARMFL